MIRDFDRSLPRNDGNLPYEHDEHGRIVGIAWRGFSIAEQFPWTRPHKATATDLPPITGSQAVRGGGVVRRATATPATIRSVPAQVAASVQGCDGESVLALSQGEPRPAPSLFEDPQQKGSAADPQHAEGDDAPGRLAGTCTQPAHEGVDGPVGQDHGSASGEATPARQGAGAGACPTPTLFDALARNTDPDTSHEAALRAGTAAAVNRSIVLIAHAEAGDRGLTGSELAEVTGRPYSSLGPRRPWLEDAELLTVLRDALGDVVKRTNERGNPERVYVCTPAGFDLARRLRAEVAA